MDMNDDMGEPDDAEGWGLVFPFVVCESADDPFVAGYQAGRIDTALAAAAAVGATNASYTVRSDLVPQLELIAMHHGFPSVTAEVCEGTPEWSWVTFSAEK